MKINKYGLALLCVFATALCNAQRVNKSTTAAGTTTNVRNTDGFQNLYMVGRVWGLLKYFHPAVAQGKYDWDAELFKELLKVNTDKKEFDIELSRWIESLGSITTCSSCKPAITDSLLAHNTWIADKTFFSKETSALLRNVIINRNADKNKYVNIRSTFNNPDFSGEESYSELKNIDLNFRLLALFRFWNMVEYYYPYKNIIGEDWNQALFAMIPEFVNAKTPLDYKLAAWEMINRIHDTHANLYSNYRDPQMVNFMGGNRQLPVIIHRVEDKYVVAGLRDSINYTQLKLGDIILKIDGQSVEERAEKLLQYACASNQITAYRNVGLNLLRSDRDTITLQIIRSNHTIDLKLFGLDYKTFGSMVLENIDKAEKQTPYRLFNPHVGYVRFDMTHADFTKHMFDKFVNTKGIIMDLRYYPAVSVKLILRKYMNEKAIEFAKFSYTGTDHPGLFIGEKKEDFGTSNKNPYKGKVVVLINEESQSAAEFSAMALRARDNTILLGSQTAGADGDISMIKLPGGLFTYFSGVGVYYPDGKGTQRVGIIPDIIVKPTIKGLSEGRDELLEFAIDLVDK